MKKVFQHCLRSLGKIPIPLRYGLLLGLVLISLKTIEYSVFSYRLRQDLHIGITSIVFLILGIGIAVIWLKNQNNTRLKTPALTAKELKLLRGLAQGLTNQQLAEASFVSVNTVKTQLKTLYKKLEIANRAQAVQKAQSLSLI